MPRTNTGVLAILVLLALISLSTDAKAITIISPLAGEAAVCDNGPEQAVVINSGHYAIASGTSSSYVWSSLPAGCISFDYTPHPFGHTVRYMTNQNACKNIQWQPIYIVVTDMGNLSTDMRMICPAKLSWKEATGYRDDDRLVHNTLGSDAQPRRRVIRFIAYGGTSIKELHIRTYNNTKYVMGQPVSGEGTIDVVEFDGDPNNITGGPAQAPATGDWMVTIPVSTSVQGTEHTLTIEGTNLSAFYLDIEIDLVNRQFFATSLYDGVGAVMDYTVVVLNAIVDSADELREEDPGIFVLLPGQSSLMTQYTLNKYIPDVLPEDLDEAGLYKLTEDKIDSEQTPRLETSCPPPYWHSVNDGLPASGFCVGRSHSPTDLRDTALLLRMRAKSDDFEVGGETCVDRVNFTMLRVDFAMNGNLVDSPHRTGINRTGASVDVTQALTATVCPAAAADLIGFDTPGDLVLSNVARNGDVWSMNLLGTTQSTSYGDQQIDVTYPDPRDACLAVSVVVPGGVHTPDIDATFGVAGLNMALDGTTSPTKWGLPPNYVFLCTCHIVWLNIQVDDQLGDPLAGDEALYVGCPVTENLGSPINQTLQLGSTYSDPVHTFTYIAGRDGQRLGTDPYVTTFLAQAPYAIFNPYSSTQDIPVEIDGWPLNPGIAGRFVETLTGPERIHIDWPR